MSVFGALFTAVSGLSAQSTSIGMISNNIANVNTVGYKRIDSDFASLVTTESRSTAYAPGSVRSIQRARVSEQGILQQSSSATDVAVSGNGFFVVKNSATDTTAEPVYTRAGSFSEDASGVLRNSAGYFLQGWPIDQNGNLPASQADISSLEPINVAFLGGLTLPTTAAALSMNLQADETPTSYPVTAGFTADFSRSIKVYDSLGAGHDLTVNFKKMESPTTSAIGGFNIGAIVGAIGDHANFDGTETFTIQVGGIPAVAQTVTLDGDVAQLLSDINGITDPATGLTVAYANLDENGYLVIRARNIGDNIIMADGVGTPLALATKLNMPGAIGTTAAPTAPTLLTPLDATNAANTEGWWEVDFRTPTGAIISSGSVNFTGGGALNGSTDLNGEIPISLTNIDWANGADLQDIDFDMAGFTQFSGQYNVISSSQNGAELGLRTGVSIDEDGFVVAQFSNGQSSRLFKLAIATFANENGLTELSGNVYRESDSSGSFNLREANQGSAGGIASGSLEASNVDLADEFSKMIVTQRAYSSNTKVINTADQMLEELLRLR